MKRIKWLKSLVHTLSWISAIICSLLAGYFITSLIFKKAGPLITYIFFAFVSLIMIAASWNLYMYAFNGKKQGELRMGPVKSAIEAMNRISQGNFSVSLDPDGIGPYEHLVESVNKMAKGLGDIETLRLDFVSNVSHEIQSPLTSINGYATLLENDDLTPEQHKRYIDIIKAESGRLSKLSSNLLKLSSLDSGVTPIKIKKFSLDTQLQNIAVLLEPQWSEKNISITADLGNALISADEELLSQVWINLMHNAIKFTPNDGTIHIALSFESGKTICTISDSGIGIAPEDQAHIFERFYKIDKSRDRLIGGNGLGLSLVKKIVELHGGSIKVESELGSGSAFIVTL